MKNLTITIITALTKELNQLEGKCDDSEPNSIIGRFEIVIKNNDYHPQWLVFHRGPKTKFGSDRIIAWPYVNRFSIDIVDNRLMISHFGTTDFSSEFDLNDPNLVSSVREILSYLPQL